MANSSPSSAPSQAPRGGTGGDEPVIAKGPFFLFLLMMPAFILIIGMLLVAMQYKQLHAFVSDKPMAMESIPVSAEAQEQVLAKVRAFIAPPASGGPVLPSGSERAGGDTLALSGDDITHLSRTSKVLNDQHFDYNLALSDSLLVARNSLSVSTLRGGLGTLAALLRVKGFLNSEMHGYPEFKEGKITMIPVGAVMNGMPAPASVLSQKGPIDVRDWVTDKDFYDQALRNLSEVKVSQARLLLIRKHRS
ncbi:MAG: hypothetical protein ABI036_01875 [Fibrobacteria bacterium]